ncbi:MAG: PAS domain-containing protein, partial [Treponema sp.]|nr:PAS domain-containing protein [Treponema sp.]
TECLNMIGDLKEIPGSAELVLQMEDFYFETALTALKDLKSKLENYRPDGSGAKFSNALSGHAKLTGALDRAVVLFNSMNSKTFKDSLAGSLSAIADAMDIDRIIIYKKAEIQGEDRMKQIYRWDRGEGGLTEVSLNYLPNTQIIMDWHNKLLKDECVNEKLGGMSSDQAEFINMFGIKSILMAPIKMNSRVLGSITFQDHRNERPFDDECISLARSFAHLCANSVIYTEMERESGEQIEFNRAMFDSSPVGIAIFDEHINIQDCNEAVLSLLGISKDYYIQHFFDLSPEYQPDGIKSRDKALDLYKRLAAGERLVLEWMHCNPAGENIPCELTVTRAVNHSKYMGLAFIKRK